MSKAPVIIGVLLLAQALVLGPAADAYAADTQMAPAEREIRSANDAELAGFRAADPKALAPLWSDTFVVTNPLNVLATKSQVLGMVASGTLAFTSFDRTIEYLRILGDTAFIAGSETAVWAGKMPLAGKASRLRFTAVWIRENGQWREVLRHANIIPER